MDEETEFTKLPIDERCVHKLWKARNSGYEDAAKLFQQQTDEKSAEFNKYLGLIKKFVIDSNAAAQEKGLAAALAYVENASVAGKTCGDVISGVITKCYGASRTKTKELALEVTLMYIEIEKHEVVQEELLKGLENKTPKIVTVCISTLREALKSFGPKVITIKPIMKVIPKMLEDRDKNVREETKLLAIEVFRWIKEAIKPQLQSLKPVQLTELETEFGKVADEKPTATRFLRSQQAVQAKAAATEEEETEDADDAASEPEIIDPYDLLDPVDIIAKLPKDFYERAEAKKWQDRKEVLENLQQLLTSNPKLEASDYGDLVRLLKKTVAKDTNVLVVALAAKCLAGLAIGLRKKFSPYSVQVISTFLEKFKEKKANVVQALREAIDASYAACTMEAILEDVQAALDNKNPQIKGETAAFLTRCFTKMTPVILSKKLLKPLCTSLLKTLNDTDPTVRDNTSEALGTAMKVVSERIITPFLQDVDALKMTKIKEFCDKAEIVAPVASKAQRVAKIAKPAAKATVPSPAASEENLALPSSTRAVSAPAAIRKTNINNKPRPTTTSKAGARGGQVGKKPGKAQPAETLKEAEFTERELTDEEVSEMAQEMFPAEVMTHLCSTIWKERNSALEKIREVLEAMPKENIPTQLVVKLLSKKPGLKDNNVQVSKVRFDTLLFVVENGKISRCTLSICLTDLVDKISDPKNGITVMASLMAFGEALTLEYVSMEVLQVAFTQKNPKNQSESLNWLGNAIKEFGFKVNTKFVVDYIKKSLAATNPAVRTAAVSLVAVIHMYMGKTLRVLFENEKPALLQMIDAELEKVQDAKPPVPIRGASKKNLSEDGAAEEEDQIQTPFNLEDLVPRSDISEQITEALLTELEDKNWKIRAEALQKIAAIIDEAKFITSNIGELPSGLKARLSDSNKNLAAQALTICTNLANALGPHCKNHVRSVAPGLLIAIGDSKNNVRSAAVTCLNCWLDNANLASFFESEMISDALRTENPVLRVELMGWLAEKLPTVKSLPVSELNLCISHIYCCLEDRNAEVRKKAQDCLLPFMVLLKYEPMARAAGKLKPASKNTVMPLLDKVRQNLPAKAPPAKLKPPNQGNSSMPPPALSASDDSTKYKMTRSSSKTKIAAKAMSAPPAGKSGKMDDDDSAPALVANNMKSSRFNDEKNLKVLKWNFTAPREEFYVLLKEQMLAGNWGRNLVSYCFHNDFKFHLKAIDIFIESLNTNIDATIANTDLILKWLALRFFDTNPSVLMKGLEYLLQLLPAIKAHGYKLHDYEANSFIPYLVLKLGDSKDSVRKGVRDIIYHIFKIFPASKVFSHVMAGLASKNSRQRAECLEVLGFMFEMFSLGVCQPSPAVALKEVAKLISDRDNGVRTAALNCVVTVYHLEGEKVYKLIGQLNDKESSLLEERIKRSTKRNSGPSFSTATIVKETHLSPPNVVETPTSAPSSQKSSPLSAQESQQPDARKSRLRGPRPRSIGPLQLEVDDIEKMFKPNDRETRLPEPVNMNADEILSLPDIELPKTKLRPTATALKMLNNSSEASMALNLVMAQLTSQDIPVVVEAFVQVEEVLRQEDKAEMALSSRVDQLLLMGAMQYRLAHNKHMSDETICKADVVKLFRCVTLTLTSLFDHPRLSKLASRDVIRDLIPQLVTVILDTRLNELHEGPQVVRSINILVIRILQKSNPTNAMSALIKLLHDTVGNPSASERYMELIMKCLWKMLRMMSQHINELNLDRILFDSHIFLKTYPSSFWKDRQNDTPLRTIKTVLFHLVKNKKDDILNHLVLIPERHDCDLVIYLNKMLSIEKGETPHKSNRSGHGHNNPVTEGRGSDLIGSSQKHKHSTVRLSKNTHDALAEIFKKIGDKEHTKAGLQELYDFQTQHPEADIKPFLQRSSEFFQNYIHRGLSNIRLDKNVNKLEKPDQMISSAADTINRNIIPSVKRTGYSTDDLQIPPMDSGAVDNLDFLKVVAAELQMDGSKYSDPEFVEQFTSRMKVDNWETMDYRKILETDRKMLEELHKLYNQDMGHGATH